MLGRLSTDAMDNLLKAEVIGRIGCHADNRTYVVPISYVYDGINIYAHAQEGLKLELMRQNPEVCFEVDDVRDMSNWQSVICWGKFEEIKEPQEKKNALKMLLDRRLPILSSSHTHIGSAWPFMEDEEEVDGVFFRIVIRERSGRFEKHQQPSR